MRYDKLTVKAQEAIQEADSLAHSFNHSTIDADHLLLALVEQKDGVVPPLLDRIGADAGELASSVRQGLAAKPKVHGDAAQLTMAPRLSKVLNRA
ncbi:MAG: type VI secretion system ATPase TssH, partial [Spirochaetes bacterium]|nr:type VI secretion system ATPase TssH [Spirochaetota bacterium]